MANGSTAMPEAAVETTGTSGVEARVTNAVLESRAEKPTVSEEQTACPETLKGVVGHAVRLRSPLVVPPSTEEEDEVEEIEREVS